MMRVVLLFSIVKDSTLDHVEQRISVAQHAPAVNGAVAVEDDEDWINPALARANSAAPTTTTARRPRHRHPRFGQSSRARRLCETVRSRADVRTDRLATERFRMVIVVANTLPSPKPENGPRHASHSRAKCNCQHSAMVAPPARSDHSKTLDCNHPRKPWFQRSVQTPALEPNPTPRHSPTTPALPCTSEHADTPGALSFPPGEGATHHPRGRDPFTQEPTAAVCPLRASCGDAHRRSQTAALHRGLVNRVAAQRPPLSTGHERQSFIVPTIAFSVFAGAELACASATERCSGFAGADAWFATRALVCATAAGRSDFARNAIVPRRRARTSPFAPPPAAPAVVLWRRSTTPTPDWSAFQPTIASAPEGTVGSWRMRRLFRRWRSGAW